MHYVCEKKQKNKEYIAQKGKNKMKCFAINKLNFV